MSAAAPASPLSNRLSSVGVRLVALVFACVLVLVTVQSLLSLTTANERNQGEEIQELDARYTIFRDEIATLQRTAIALATSFADRRDVQQMLIESNREAMLDLLTPVFERLKSESNIAHLYIHEPDGFVFLRVHDPTQYGDNFISYRQTIADVIETEQPAAGLELDPNRLGIRGIAPVFDGERFIGMVEIGLNYDQEYLADLQARTDVDYTLWIGYDAAAPTGLWPSGGEPASPSDDLFFYSSTRTTTLPVAGAAYDHILAGGEPEVQFILAEGEPFAVLLAPLRGYDDALLGVVEIASSRDEALALAAADQGLILGVAALLGAAGLALIGYTINRLVLRPLGYLTLVAQRQYEGDLHARVERPGRDEFGQLGRTFNSLSQKLGETLEAQQQTIAERERLIRQLRETSRFKDEFLAVMSHELRTPLNAMIGLLGITLMRGQMNPQDTLMVTRARANSDRLLTLINDILDISRMEAGRLQIVPSPVSLSRIVDKLKSDMGILAEQKKLYFDTRIDPTLPDPLMIDEDAINKILINLVGNAFKFTEEGGVTLDLARRDEQMVITVADTGVGIPVHLHEVIFDTFRQADGSSTRAHGGSGLGLAIVRNLVTALKGSIRLESAPGSGTTFTVTLPLAAQTVLGQTQEAEYVV